MRAPTWVLYLLILSPMKARYLPLPYLKQKARRWGKKTSTLCKPESKKFWSGKPL